jgi:AraC-like DNA-binding protein
VDRRIETVLGLIDRDIRCAPRVPALAREARLSVSRLHELFRQATGAGPGSYIRARRFEEARRLLLGTHLSVKEVAEQVGFHDDSHFVRDFERIYGMSPRKFRRAHESVRP